MENIDYDDRPEWMKQDRRIHLTVGDLKKLDLNKYYIKLPSDSELVPLNQYYYCVEADLINFETGEIFEYKLNISRSELDLIKRCRGRCRIKLYTNKKKEICYKLEEYKQ